MKKVIALAFIAASIAACNDETNRENVETTENTVVHSDDIKTTYNPSEGDVTYRNNMVLVWKNGEWVETHDDVTLDDGVVVYSNGRVQKNEKVVVLNDGEVVTKTGRFFDRAGNAIENAWEATKEGVKDAANAVKDAAEKTGDKIEDAADRNKKH